MEIDLRPRDGGTELHLVHRGLPGPMADAHSGGWTNYLARLAAVAEGRDPGPDPLAGGTGARRRPRPASAVTARRPRPEQERFWTLARPLLRRAGVTRSTMMGFPCLRLDGDFFASCDHRTGELVVKLNEQRARALVDLGEAEPFAPNGRRFREWVTVPHQRHRSWPRLLEEALDLAAARKRD